MVLQYNGFEIRTTVQLHESIFKMFLKSLTMLLDRLSMKKFAQSRVSQSRFRRMGLRRTYKLA